MEKRVIKFTDTTCRDAHQSLLATRMKIEHILPIIEKIDAIGYHSLEVWGGATFDTTMRFLGEDPWERLWEIKKHCKTPLQMLLRGQNCVGYKHYPDDVLEAFIKYACQGGMNIFRVFDALNDIRNMEKSFEYVKKYGGHNQAVLCFTTSPVHNVKYFVDMAKEVQKRGADSICIKDMAGIAKPADVAEVIRGIKNEMDIMIQVHTHYTSGMGAMMYLKAIEAGADVVDTAISSLSMSTSQPAVETMVAALEGLTDPQGRYYETGLSQVKLKEIADYYADVRKEYAQFDLTSGTPDTNVLVYQVPGGMISNFLSQLAQQNALDKLPEVLAEVPRVREDFGYPPLVTPSSQIVGAQAALNVLVGERYKIATNEVKQYMRGFYGKPPGFVNEEIRKKIIGDDEVITCRPADVIEPAMQEARNAVAAVMQKEEDVVTYAIFPNIALGFLEERLAKKTQVDFTLAKEGTENGKCVTYPA
ncbi:pyruvate carboxylase subunit B [Heliophilum fasciatum]|uniref:Oxaloacetate decarboxylase alpha subunit n=1 Tax=Heliophilum fasciatum TaxID=35700 RepID=A0A4R2RSL3_9FIRM|nr:pyruvate carboxylase subunit B [Heliophilum fasciatum]MCW2277404.1 oxaloacetate decarboxylase alpha subunit [Heliophilum fasciatum]TCP67240.1 oxaloacetate decarboxylase alpha subunit [Heliophilum fasciatum]